MKTQYLPNGRVSALILIMSLVMVLCTAQLARAESDVERTVESTHYSPGGRDDRQAVKTTRDDFAPTIVDKTKIREVTKTGTQNARSVSNDFWFYSADIVLFGDEDFDGYYSGIDLLFDADTVYNAADVYAVLYLSFEGGPWEEYAVTENFTIFGASDNDDYSVVSDLVAGYPTGSYDVLVELFDAFNDDFLAFIGPDDTSELGFLPLEDIARDTPRDTTVVISTEGGGAMGLVTLSTILTLTLFFRLLSRRRRTAVVAGRDV